MAVQLKDRPQTEQAGALQAHARGPFPTSIPTITRTPSFARILRMLPRLPLSPFSTSVEQHAEVLLHPPTVRSRCFSWSCFSRTGGS